MLIPQNNPHSDADCRARRRKQADGNAHIAATGPSRIKGSCSACDLSEQDDQTKRPYISTAMGVHPTAAIAGKATMRNLAIQLTVSIASLAIFEERAKSAISFGVQEKSDFSYMNGETDGDGGSFYGMAPVEPEPAEIERKPHESGNVVTVLVDSRASGHYFNDTIIPDLKHRLQDYASLNTPRTILPAGGALLDGTAEGV